jgi:hypothetical protein
MQEAIEKTDWSRCRFTEAMLSSTHDPCLPLLRKWKRIILEKALKAAAFQLEARIPYPYGIIN